MVPGEERVPRRKIHSKKGNERTQREEEIVQMRKKEFKHGTRIYKSPHYCRCWNWLHLQPTPPLPTTQTEERLKDKGDPTRTKRMNEMITGTRSRTTLIMGPEHLYIYLYFSSFFYHVTGSNTHMCVGASNELQKESHPGKKHYRVKLRDQLHEPFYSTSELPLFLVFNSVANDVTKLAILIAYYPSGKRHGSETILRTRENREGWPLLWKLRQMLTQEVHIKEILRCLFR
jgi:hypothetical protein